ncbi:kinase-like protein [Thelephora terrestris]|uniref:Kinase-like protein n=1 Tax=Thelephora terrestris TaxID=56493 RepID=A0A9P6HH49_9AGAM|nr:kinase-like protein [Thelephora terrestris]
MYASTAPLQYLFGVLTWFRELIHDGPFSTVYRDPGPPQTALKLSIADRKFAKEPHDIHKEIRLLSTLSCPNVIKLLAHDQDSGYCRMWMPYIPHSLATLVNSPSFTAFSTPDLTYGNAILESRFVLLSKGILHQIFVALAYLHSHSIAHRDIKPSNVLITEVCQVKLIDFGIAWTSSNENDGDLWPETQTNMYTEVATGPYRAPELLFGPKTYDAFAADMWSLGATFAEYFRPLKEQADDLDEWDDERNEEAEDDQQNEPPPFIFLRNAPPTRMTSWRRLPLFDAERGDIGLAWSIFKVRGTPNETNWPDFLSLPHAKLLTFEHADPVDLRKLLPHMPATPKNVALDGSRQKPSPLDVLDGLLLCSPSARMTSAQALQHPWFNEEDTPLLYPDTLRKEEKLWNGHGLGYWFLEVMG